MYIDDILKEIARKDKVSPEYVREQMQLAILDIYSKQDQSPLIRSMLDNIPHKGEIPTVEEFIPYLASFVAHLREQDTKAIH